MTIQPAIQPQTPREGDSRPDQPPFAGELEDASRALAPVGRATTQRESGAGEPADPAPTGIDEAAGGPAGTEPTRRSTDDAPAPEGQGSSEATDAGPAPDATSGDRTDDANPGTPEPRARGAVVDPASTPRSEQATGLDAIVEVDAERIEERRPVEGRTATSGRGVEAVSATAVPADATTRVEASPHAGPGTATAASAAGALRSSADQRSPARVEAAGTNPSTATPVANPGGGRTLPEGMRPIESTAAAMTGRPRVEAKPGTSDRHRGDAAANRAAQVNAELRNARDTAVATSGSRPGGEAGANLATAAGTTTTGMTGTPVATAATAATPEAQSLPTGPASVAPMESGIDSGRTVAGVARGLQALTSQRGGTLVMRLDPGNLGQVRMEMSLDAGRVQVVIAAAGDAARGLLRENLGALRNALEDRGFAVERLTVESSARTTTDTSGSRGESRGDGQDARGGQGSSDRQDASDERSRGRRDEAGQRRSERNRADSDRFHEVLADSGVASGE